MTGAKRLAAVLLIGAVTLGILGSAALARSNHAATRVFIKTVTSSPGGRAPLAPRHLNVVAVHPDLSFRVALRNGSVQHHVKVTLTITRERSTVGPIVKRKTLSLRPNGEASIKFGDIGTVLFAQRETLKVTVTDSQRREVWSRIYPVIFSLG